MCGWIEVENDLTLLIFTNTDKKGKHLHLASAAVKDRKVLGWLVQRTVRTLSHLPCAKTASARRLDLSQR